MRPVLVVPLLVGVAIAVPFLVHVEKLNNQIAEALVAKERLDVCETQLAMTQKGEDYESTRGAEARDSLSSCRFDLDACESKQRRCASDLDDAESKLRDCN